MRVTLNTYSIPKISMGISPSERAQRRKNDKKLSQYMQVLSGSKTAIVPPLSLMEGINPNARNVFDSFSKIDDKTREINFVKSKDAWDDCMLEEMEEFTIARLEYEQNPTKQNFDHMEEEMGDIFFTASSIAKDSGINPEEAFRATNRKFYNRINVMEKMLELKYGSKPKDLRACSDQERRALWNAAKRKIYDVQASRYTAIA